MSQCNEIKEKLSGYIDEELPQQQSQQVRIHIESCEKCKQSHDEILAIQENINRIPGDEGEAATLNKIIQDLGARQSRQWGWVLLIIGALMMIGYSFIRFFISDDINSFEKIMALLLGTGGLLLFFSVLRQRLIIAKSDKYKDINL